MKTKTNIFLLLSFAIFTTTIACNIDFVPIWDGKAFYDEMALALLRPFNLLNFNLHRHPSMLYILLIAITQYLDFGNSYLIHLVNLILGILSIWSFFRIVEKFFPSQELLIEKSLVTMIFAGFPIFISNALNLNLDFGVLVFFLLFLSMILYRKKYPSLVTGYFLVFSKEVGVLLYITILFLMFLYFVSRSEKSVKEKIDSIRKWGILILPPIGYVSYLFYLSIANSGPVLWQNIGSNPLGLLRNFTSFSLLDPVFLSYLKGIFIINFNWIFTFFIVLLLGKWSFNIAWGKKLNLINEFNNSYLLFLVSLFTTIVYLLTRFSPFTNLRYFLPIYPLLIISFYYSLLTFVKNKNKRIIILIFTFILVFSSNFRTIDPISKKLYGTFNFGDHPILKMTEVTGECCGYGRDQLVYNLEYIKFNLIQNKIYQNLIPLDKTVFVTNKDVDWHFAGRIDQKTLMRTLNFPNTHFLSYYDPGQILRAAKKPEIIYYLDYPNFNSKNDLELLLTNYRDLEIKNVGDEGYFVTIHKMVLKI